jgi:RNA binding exosome subunit
MAYEDIKGLAIHLNNTEELEASFTDYLQVIRNSLVTALVKESYQVFIEDFTIYYFRDWQKDWDAVPLLLAEPEPVSPQMRKETLNNSFTYGLGDLTIITWDSALVYDINGSTDIPDLLEFAVSQLLELRYYDSLLSQEMEKMYNAIEAAETQFRRLNNYQRIMKQIMELVVDISEITERIQNSLKVTEDVFYARVYSGALNIFRTKEWMDNIQHKISVIQRNYTMLSEEITTRRSMWLEVAIVFLFILEIVLNFTPLLHK